MLKVLAARHSHRDLDITPELYEYWMNALIGTVKVYDPQFDDVTADSWRHVLTPGVEYMKSRYSDPEDPTRTDD